LLRQVAVDIEGALERDTPHHASTVETLERETLAFEQRHPALTEAVQAVADLLRKAGV